MDVNAAQAKPVDASDQARYGLRLGAWLLLYAVLITPWGIYNHWPGSLVVAAGYLPFCLLVAAGLGRRHQFGIETPDPPSHWELLISFLLLAVGIATGYMLLISVAWICVGVAWLRPVARGLPWGEWYKLPVLFLFCMPMLSDVAGSRHGWLFAFGGGESGAGGISGWKEDLREPVLFRCGLLALAWLAPGACFWTCLGLLPLVFLGAHVSERVVPAEWRGIAQWLLPGAGVGFILALARWRARTPAHRGLWFEAAVTEFKHRTHALWLTALVTLMQQQSLVEVWLAGGRSKLDITGATFLLLVLGITRLATHPTPVDFRSRAILVASQLILFAAEFTDLNPLRHVALGIFLVAAISWGRTWNWLVFAAASACWITTIPTGEVVLTTLGLGEANASLIRLGAFLGTIIAAVGSASQAVNHPSVPSATQHDWQPEQRFVLILLLLLLLFQGISAIYGEPSAPPHRVVTLAAIGGRTPGISRTPGEPSRPWTERYDVEWDGRRFELRIAHVGPAPVDVLSTEMLLRGEDWRPENRVLIPHDRGQAGSLDLQQPGRTAHAVYWFTHANRTFVNHLRARRVLWSSWNLSRRDLHFYMLIGDAPISAADLAEFAQAQHWFLPNR
jgi:hypothetical protein